MLHEGDLIAINGTTGEVTNEDVPLVEPKIGDDFRTCSSGPTSSAASAFARTPTRRDDARKARELGAEGIGLCRTEHMFMQADRQPKMKAMIVAETEEERREALDELLPLQRSDFEGIFEAMEGLPVTIRLLDPPLHEFLPRRGRARQGDRGPKARRPLAIPSSRA